MFDSKPLPRDPRLYLDRLPNEHYLIHHLCYQNDDYLLEVLRIHPHLATGIFSTDGRCVPHILASMGYEKLFLRVAAAFPGCVEVLDRQGNHVLHHLVGNPEFMKHFLEAFPLTWGKDQHNTKGITPLVKSILQNDQPSFLALLQNGADPNGSSTTSEGPLIVYATGETCLEWLSIGKRYGMILDRRGLDGRHILDEALDRDRDLFTILVNEWHIPYEKDVEDRKQQHTRAIDLPVASPSFHETSIYSPSIHQAVIFLLTLLDRYSQDISLPLRAQKKLRISHLDDQLSLTIKVRLTTIRELSRTLDNFIEYASPSVNHVPKIPKTFPSDRMTVYILSLIAQTGNHSNVLIIDPKHHTIERFDPEGQPDPVLDAWLQNKVFGRTMRDEGFTFHQTKTSLQLLDLSVRDRRPGDPIGYCTAWCMWYVELRARNRDENPDDLLRNATDKLLKKGVRRHIRTYALALSHRRNKFVSSLLPGDTYNREEFTAQEKRVVRKSIDRWLRWLS